jgi:hypothetical protein
LYTVKDRYELLEGKDLEEGGPALTDFEVKFVPVL